jgi:hypothetical protein
MLKNILLETFHQEHRNLNFFILHEKKSSWAISHVNIDLKTSYSEMSSISETLVFNPTLTWLLTEADFNIFVRHESFKSYIFHFTVLNMEVLKILISYGY